MGTGRRFGGWKCPSGVQGHSLSRRLGQISQKPEECYVMRLIKTTYGEKKQANTC